MSMCNTISLVSRATTEYWVIEQLTCPDATNFLCTYIRSIRNIRNINYTVNLDVNSLDL